MKIERAKEILQSSEEFLVTYQNVPIWIQRVDEVAQTASVSSAAKPGEDMIIPVEDLEEK